MVKHYRISKKVRLREKREEALALKHAKLYQSSMCELVQRLNSDTYGDIYNCPETEFIGGAGQSEAKAVNDIIEG